MQQGVDQRSPAIAVPRMHDKTGRLGKEQEKFILVKDAEIYLFRFDMNQFWFLDKSTDRFSCTETVAAFSLLPIDQNMAVTNGCTD